MLVGAFSEDYRFYIWMLIPSYFSYIGATYIVSWCGWCKKKEAEPEESEADIKRREKKERQEAKSQARGGVQKVAK